MTEQLLNSSLSKLSKNSYRNSIAKFEVFCVNSLRCVHWFPASTASVVSFTSSLFIQNYAASTIASTLSAISFFHKMHGFSDPTASFVVKKLLQGAAKLRPSRDHRAPITLTILHQLVVSTSVSTDCYFNSVLMSAIYLLAFYAFLRIGEIIPSSQSTTGDVLQLDQVEVDAAHLTILFRSFKHHHGPPVTLLVSAQDNPKFCPVRLMKCYLVLRGSQPGPLFVFPGGGVVTRSFFTDQLSKSLCWAGLPTDIYKGHSFRIGSATQAAMDGVSEEDIQRMGRWKSHAFKRYIRIPMLHCNLR